MSIELRLPATDDKEAIFTATRSYVGELSLRIIEVEATKPWGGWLRINEDDAAIFITSFFPDYEITKIRQYGSKLGLKLLLVGPGEELSWQYHHRRAELWRCVDGPVGFKRSKSDEQGETTVLAEGEVVQFDPCERHRLIGMDSWGVVAEFWQHTDPENPSDEDDIVRLEDKYGR